MEQQLDMLNQEVLDEQQHSFDDERGHKLVQNGSFFNLRKSMAAELSDDVTITDNTVNSEQIFAQAEGDEHQWSIEAIGSSHSQRTIHKTPSHSTSSN